MFEHRDGLNNFSNFRSKTIQKSSLKIFLELPFENTLKGI